jgi:hypothetical protein
MIARAYEVHYGNSLSTLFRDLGAAERGVMALHGTKITALYELTEDEIRLLRLTESEKKREPR